MHIFKRATQLTEVFFTFPVLERTLLPLYLFLYITCLLFRFENFRNMLTFAKPTCKKVKKVTEIVKITQKVFKS